MSTFDAPLRHDAGEDPRETSISDPGTVRGRFTFGAGLTIGFVIAFGAGYGARFAVGFGV
jgi:hypothetical protein